MTTRKPKAKKMTAADLTALSADFERPDYVPQFTKPAASEQRQHDRALRAARKKRGRPPVGNGAERIQITVERTLLAEADDLARRQQISRSELIARSLRMALAS